MEHEHIIITELTAISSRLQSLARHLVDDHEKRHWQNACTEIDTLLALVENRIVGAGGGY